MILLVGNYVSDGQRSMSRYCKLLQMALESHGRQVEVWTPPVVLGRFANPKSRAFKWIAYVDKLLVGPLALAARQVGASRVHICDHSNSFYAFVVWGRRCTATCHDVIAIQAARGQIPGWHVGKGGRAFQKLIGAGLGAVDQVLCVSEHTRHDLLALQLAAPARLVVAPNPLDPAFGRQHQAETAPWTALRVQLRNRYVMHVGSDLPRKNRLTLLKIFAHLRAQPLFADVSLLLVGPTPSAEQRNFLQSANLLEWVQQVGFLADTDLAAAYRGALALVFPSLQEGFGWPVAEAQICGCPVFASNLAPLPEVGGQAARYFDPCKPQEAAALIANAPLAAMRAAGRLHAQRYSLARLAEVFGR